MNRRELLGAAAAAAVIARRASAQTLSDFPPIAAPTASASSAFWKKWGDGKAEMSGYRAVTSRYGELRAEELALIYVTEPLDRRTRIKDDSAKDACPVMKLNVSEKFMTGIYPYSVMTSVFSAVDRYGALERFSPVKVTLSVQEWCGSVMMGLWPSPGSARLEGFSYFASEGDVDTSLSTPDGVLFEDALLVQMRELDGPFLGGAALWSGSIVPSLWAQRKTHSPLAVVPAKITRAAVSDAITRFELRKGDFVRTYDVERAGDKRVVAWAGNDGSKARITKTERLAYWTMNGLGNEKARAKIGLDPEGKIIP